MGKFFSLFWSFVFKYGILLLIIYILFILGRVVWKNYQINVQIEKVNKEIAQLKDDNKNMENLILYYSTDSFKEIEARRKLGLKKPDEKVIAVDVSEEEKPIESFFNQSAQRPLPTPNYIKWWNKIIR